MQCIAVKCEIIVAVFLEIFQECIVYLSKALEVNSSWTVEQNLDKKCFTLNQNYQKVAIGTLIPLIRKLKLTHKKFSDKSQKTQVHNSTRVKHER